jgi:hypothetical protein
LLSRGLAERGTVFADFSAASITEIYALALIGGAALLTRIGQRRPGVMLALLAVVYQGDLAFHTEACTYHGGIGIAGTVTWVALFAGKFYALAWAVRVRPSRVFCALAAYAGIGLAVIPHVISRMNGERSSVLVALWVFSLAALAFNGSPTIASKVELDAWGRTVLRRSLCGVWLLWTAVIVTHVVVWSMTFSVNTVALIPVALLVGTRAVRRESHVWAMVTATMICVALVAPGYFASVALMSAATLALRAIRCPQPIASTLAQIAPPFRVGTGDVAASASAPTWVLAPATPDAQRRLSVGALFASYLAAWTMQWSGGAWPRHVVWVDLLFAAIVLFMVVGKRVRIALLPVVASCVHAAVQTRVVSAPDTTLEWGALLTSGAFALLVTSLAVSYWLRGVGSPRSPSVPVPETIT